MLWRTNLARHRSLTQSLEQITRVAARTMEVERVGVWLFDQAHLRIRCLCLYSLSADRHTSGMELTAAEYPAYFRALATSRAVAADEAQADVRTQEFTAEYLTPIGITSMMDAPIRVDGATVGVLCHEHVGPGRHWDDETQVFAGSLADLTAFAIQTDARARAERSLAESDRRHGAILSSLGDAVVVIDADARVGMVNPATERLLRVPTATCVGRPVAELLVPSSESGVPDPSGLGAFLAAGLGDRGSGWRFLRRADGTVVPVLHRVTSIAAAPGEVVDADRGSGRTVVVLHDMTESRTFEEGIRRAERMEAVGALAGGIAHDFNNLLTAIIGCSQLLLERTPRSDPSFGLIDEIHRAGDRSGTLARKLLSLARGQELRPVSVDLNAVVTELRSLLGRVAGESVSIVFELASGLPRVTADIDALEQVVVNLVANARDSMPSGGPLTISTESLEVLGERDRVILRVRDRGCGIPPHVLPRIFDPFFTTKEVGKGTGLGLSIVHGIVTRSGGRINVASTEGRGTTFVIELPREGTDGANAAPGLA